MHSTSWEILGWRKHKLGEISISITSDMQMTPPLWQKMKKNQRASRWKWKCWLKSQHSENKDHGIQSHHFMANRWVNNGNSDRLYSGGSKIAANGDCCHEIKRCLLLGRKAMTNLDSILKSRDIILPTKDHNSENYGFTSNHVRMWELDHREGQALRNWCFWTVTLEKTPESPLDCKEIKLVNLREINPE